MKEILETKKVNVNGNKIAVCTLDAKTFENFKENFDLRKYLVNEFKTNIDTVMAVTKLDDEVVKTVIFEPNFQSIDGNFGNMCGNGLRAIAQVTKSKIFITPAGTFYMTNSSNEKFICVRECNDIRDFGGVNINLQYLKSLKKIVENILGKNLSVLRLCANADNPSNGEPHLVLIFEERLMLENLIKLAKEKGFEISYLINEEFQTNVTFVSINKDEIIACTFERNLGMNPEIAVTGSCGTGAIAAADTLKKYIITDKDEFVLNFPKDKQKILIKNNQNYILTTNNYESI